MCLGLDTPPAHGQSTGAHRYLRAVPSRDEPTFSDAIELQPRGAGHFDGSIIPGWDVRGIPHGGYLLAMLARAACLEADKPDPISIAANFLAPPEFGPARLTAGVIRSGKRQSTLSVRMVQADVVRVDATVTVGTVADGEPRAWSADAVAPLLPDPQDCIDLAAASRGGDDPGVALHDRLDLRLHPSTGWMSEQPSGSPVLDGWLRLHDETDPDLFALLMFSDGFPPSIFEATGRAVGHVPTVQLTTHVFARPAPGWIQSRCRTRVQGNGFVDEDCELWDSMGRLVATARQLALLR